MDDPPRAVELLLDNPCRYVDVRRRELRPWLTSLVAELAPRAASFAVRFTSDREMQRLNRGFRGKDSTTDVLSFPGEAGPSGGAAESEGWHLGDVVIAVPTARRQAADRGHDVERELRTLLLHGLLHCLGHDHETDDGAMERLERRLRRRWIRELSVGPDRHGDCTLMEGRWLAMGAIGAMLGAWLLSVLAALLERSGPIRLRHWAQEAGSLLRNLYAKTPRFEAFRFLLSLLARLMLVACYALVAAALLQAGVESGVAWAFLPVLLLVAGAELVNRHLVGRNPEAALSALTPFFRWMAALLGPLLPLVAPALPRPITEEAELEEASRAEIDAFIDVGRKEGILEPAEEELVRGVVDFGATQVYSVMTPRIDIIAAPLSATPTEVAELVLASGHSRIPIYRESIDEIVGILHVRELLRSLLRHSSETPSNERQLLDLLQPPHFVPETKTLAQLLRELQERHQEMAIVVDEYGGNQGIVTVEDLLEEVFGEMGDAGDGATAAPIELADGSWRIDGRTHLEELEDLFGVRIPDDAEWETVGGMIFGLLENVPRVGESVETYGLRFTVEGADHRRARRVKVERLPPSEEAEVD